MIIASIEKTDLEMLLAQLKSDLDSMSEDMLRKNFTDLSTRINALTELANSNNYGEEYLSVLRKITETILDKIYEMIAKIKDPNLTKTVNRAISKLNAVLIKLNNPMP